MVYISSKQIFSFLHTPTVKQSRCDGVDRSGPEHDMSSKAEHGSVCSGHGRALWLGARHCSPCLVRFQSVWFFTVYFM